jgi:hypothetical protein
VNGCSWQLKTDDCLAILAATTLFAKIANFAIIFRVIAVPDNHFFIFAAIAAAIFFIVLSPPPISRLS